MFTFLLGKLFPPKPAKTPSAETVARPVAAPVSSIWGFRDPYSLPDREARDVFCAQLTGTPPDRVFAAFARRTAALTEAQSPVERTWTDTLSPGAEALLKLLDRVHRRDPLLAVKVAAIVCAQGNYRYALTEALADRLCGWTLEDGPMAGALFDLGATLYAAWPDGLSFRMKTKLAPVLLDWVAREAERNADEACRMVRAHVADFPNNFGHIFNWDDDKAVLLRIGAAFKTVEPRFTQSVLLSSLESGRFAEESQKPPEAGLRRIADELFDMVAAAPALSPEEAGYFYNRFGAVAFPDAPWYPVILQRLFDAATTVGDVQSSARWSRSVAVNAPEASALCDQAIAWFRALTDRNALVSVLVETANIGITERREYLYGWNVSVAPNPVHPILAIASQAYWRIVEAHIAMPSAGVLFVLVTAIEGKDNGWADAAAARMRSVFRAMARINANTAGSALGKLARNAYGRVDAIRRARCVGLFDELIPVLADLSPTAADEARKRLRDPREDM